MLKVVPWFDPLIALKNIFFKRVYTIFTILQLFVFLREQTLVNLCYILENNCVIWQLF